MLHPGSLITLVLLGRRHVGRHVYFPLDLPAGGHIRPLSPPTSSSSSQQIAQDRYTAHAGCLCIDY